MSDSDFSFDRYLASVHARAGEVYQKMLASGVRIFCLTIDKIGNRYFVHDDKTVQEWRRDISEFLVSSGMSDSEDGRAGDEVYNALGRHFLSHGYVEIGQVVADVFEGRITSEHARLIHWPVEEGQSDGFGHYGWENGKK